MLLRVSPAIPPNLSTIASCERSNARRILNSFSPSRAGRSSHQEKPPNRLIVVYLHLPFALYSAKPRRRFTTAESMLLLLSRAAAIIQDAKPIHTYGNREVVKDDDERR